MGVPSGLFFFQAEDGIRDLTVTGVQTCALPIWLLRALRWPRRRPPPCPRLRNRPLLSRRSRGLTTAIKPSPDSMADSPCRRALQRHRGAVKQRELSESGKERGQPSTAPEAKGAALELSTTAPGPRCHRA